MLTGYSEEELTGRIDQLTTQLHHAAVDNPWKLDLERHQLELELQNRSLKESIVELESSRAAYSQLFECAPIAYVLLDLHGIMKEINSRAVQLLNRPYHLLKNRPFILFLDSTQTNRFFELLRNCEPSRSMVFELRNTVSEKRPMTVRLTVCSHQFWNGFQLIVQPAAICQNCRCWQRTTNDDGDLPDDWGWCKMLDNENCGFDRSDRMVVTIGNGPLSTLTAPTFSCAHYQQFTGES